MKAQRKLFGRRRDIVWVALIAVALSVPAAIADEAGTAGLKKDVKKALAQAKKAKKKAGAANKKAKNALEVAENTSKQAGPAGPQGPQGSKGDKGDPGVPPAPQTPIEVTAFVNGWTNYDAGFEVTYWKDLSGVVHLSGAVKGGTGAAVFTLPPGYRPAKHQYQPIANLAGASPAQTERPAFVEIGDAAGTIANPGRVAVIADEHAFVSLDGVSFRAG